MSNNKKSSSRQGEGGTPKDELTQYYDYAFRRALRLTQDRTEAEDITQQAFLSCLRYMDQKGWKVASESVKYYLAKTVDNISQDIRRRRAETPASCDDEHTREALERGAAQSDESIANIENRIYYKEIYEALPLKMILGGLTAFEKQLLFLRYVDGKPVTEISAITGQDHKRVRYDLMKLQVKIRSRVRKLIKKDKTANELMFGAWNRLYLNRDRSAV